ncbi:MAG: RNase A-like domain-containing protein [Thermoanaerobaculia bacterium]
MKVGGDIIARTRIADLSSRVTFRRSGGRARCARFPPAILRRPFSALHVAPGGAGRNTRAPEAPSGDEHPLRVSLPGCREPVADALTANRSQVTTWLHGNASRLRIDYVAGRTTGFTLARGATEVVPAQGARIILVRDPAMPTGYRILTSFPQ